MTNNNIQWLEIPCIDIERAKKFYETVFNLNFQAIDVPDESKMYMFGTAGEEGSCGALVEAEGYNPSTDGIVIYFNTKEINTELENLKSIGGEIIIPKTDIGEFGFFAQIIDSEGNKIGLHSKE